MEWLLGLMKMAPPKTEVNLSDTVEGDFNIVTVKQPGRTPEIHPGQYSTSYRTSTAYPQQYYNYSQQQQHSSIASSQKPANYLDSILFKITSFDPMSIPVKEYQLKKIKSQLDNALSKIKSDFFFKSVLN